MLENDQIINENDQEHRIISSLEENDEPYAGLAIDPKITVRRKKHNFS
jgi:hypothetical protein